MAVLLQRRGEDAGAYRRQIGCLVFNPPPWYRLGHTVAQGRATLLNMERPVRKRLPHQTPQWVSSESFFFVTINCEPRGRNQICQAGLGDTILAAARFYHEYLKWHCRLLVLMPDHVHGIIAFPREPGMETIVGDWKKYLARNHGVVWQRGFFDHRLRDHHELAQKTSYVLMNPVRWGLCERAEDWPWVSHPNDRIPPNG